MLRAANVLVGITALMMLTFANPLVGNVFGFCPPSEGLKAVSIDAVVALVDASAAWVIYRAVRG